MAKSKDIYNTAKNASKLHKKVGELLTSEDSFLSKYEIRQEYPVSKVNPSFKSNREKFDWVILGLKIVIEAHGIQHYTPTCFGGITQDEAKINFLSQLQRDEDKMNAALDAGWGYVVVKYTEKDITIEELIEKINNAEWHESKEIAERPKAKIQSRGFQKHKGKYKWPKRKIHSQPFPKKNS
jgi:hypothetical protein